MSKVSFEKPARFMPRTNLLHQVSSVAEASYYLLHRWPPQRGPAYFAAREACYLAALGRMNPDECRRIFARALDEAGMPVLDESTEAAGVALTEDRTSTPVTFTRSGAWENKNLRWSKERLRRARDAHGPDRASLRDPRFALTRFGPTHEFVVGGQSA
ncbi:hypothetical protein C5L14_00405 [Labrys okinawensis]|uniref:DUF982 domain-containing protein n=2 Tax=Labrys okinawensis TaxID=346911 RepID=A0A2S9QIC9_9HYPH|nr:hypothetical protein C5L14_00405 [Labrys okinawensis]